MSDIALSRLRAPDSPHLDGLIDLASREILDQPVRDVIDPALLAAQATAALIALEDSSAREAIQRRVAQAIERHADATHTLRPSLPSAAVEPLRKLLGRPVHASEELTFRLIDQGVVHTLLAEILESALRRFARRAKRVDDRLKAVDERLGGLGKRARGLFGNVASELAHAVGDELEHSVERRIREFVHQGTSEMLKVAARRLADPEQAAAWGEFRVAVLDVMLDTPVKELVREVASQDPEGAVKEVLDVLAAAARADGFEQELAKAVRLLLDEVGDGSLGAWLDELGLRDTWRKATAPVLRQQLQQVVQSNAFSAWWAALHAD